MKYEAKYNFGLWKYSYLSIYNSFQSPCNLFESLQTKMTFCKQGKFFFLFLYIQVFVLRMYMTFEDTLGSEHTALQTFQIVCH